MDLELSQSQAQASGKWVCVVRPAHLGDNKPLDTSLGKRIPANSPDSSFPTKRRAIVGANSDENFSLMAVANLQPR